jgi:hypothetical protein
MCMTIRLRERPERPARFCNRYVSSGGFFEGGGGGPLSNPIALSAAFDASDAVSIIEHYEGRPPHVASVRASVELRRGERVAKLLSVKAPKRVRAGRKATLRVRMQRYRGDAFTKRYRVRIPRGVPPGRRPLQLGFDEEDAEDEEELLAIILGIDPDELDEDEEPRPATLNDLLERIESLGRWDGVQLRVGRKRARGFLDRDLMIDGSASTSVRVVRRR